MRAWTDLHASQPRSIASCVEDTDEEATLLQSDEEHTHEEETLLQSDEEHTHEGATLLQSDEAATEGIHVMSNDGCTLRSDQGRGV